MGVVAISKKINDVMLHVTIIKHCIPSEHDFLWRVTRPSLPFTFVARPTPNYRLVEGLARETSLAVIIIRNQHSSLHL